MREVVISSSDHLLCRAEVAENLWTRGRGLLGRQGLPEDRGLWIKSCGSVHTFLMRFPIDVVYLAADGTVVKTCSRLKPYRFSVGGRRACSVLELPAGWLHRRQVIIGQKLVVAPTNKKAADTSGRDAAKRRGSVAAPRRSRLFQWLGRSGVSGTGSETGRTNYKRSQLNRGRKVRQVGKA